MKLPSYHDSKQLEENSIPAWLNYFNGLDVVAKCYYVDDKKTQTKDHWDLMIIFEGEESPIRVDIKTRAESYYATYKKYNDILIEVEGNVGNNIGSSIFNSNAEYWAYGWLVYDKILEPLVFDRKKFANWFEPVQHLFKSPPNSNTSGFYETKNKLILRDYFKPFIHPKLSYEAHYIVK